MDTSRHPIGQLFDLKISKQKAQYRFFEGSKLPESTVGELGDLYRDGSGTIWFKDDDGWSPGEDEVTKHPNLPVYLVFTSRGKRPRWVVRSTLTVSFIFSMFEILNHFIDTLAPCVTLIHDFLACYLLGISVRSGDQKMQFFHCRIMEWG
jgi:hypothetical protein